MRERAAWIERRARSTVLHYLGVVMVAFSVLQAAPLIVSAIYGETVRFPTRIYVVPAVVALTVGATCVAVFRPRRMGAGSAMAVGALGWIALSLVGAIPYWLALDVTYVDALFEAASGFTTTGATVLQGLSGLPKSILLWRALTQWIGGLGIFTLFLFVIRGSGLRHALLGAEAHKAASARFSPGVFNSLRILWSIYGGLTVVCALLLWAEGLSLFDAVAHAMTTLSTGGFSTYDQSIAHFASTGYRNAVAIEYTILLFMFLGGTSFLVHWHLARRHWRAVRANSELRAWLVLLAGAALVIGLVDRGRVATVGLHQHIRDTLFHVVSIATTTGFTKAAFTEAWVSPLTRQIFLVLMVFGGCVGSTSGGLKIVRGLLLGKLLQRRLRRASRSPNEAIPLALNRVRIEPSEVDRTIGVAVAWFGAIAVVWMAGTLVSSLSGWESLSAAVSAVGNIGPSYVSTQAFAALGAGPKLVYAAAMIAGRLEVLPLLLILSRRVWR